MRFFELESADISNLNDSDLRALVARLCEAELIQQKSQTSCVLWGGAQEAADGGLDVHVKGAKLNNPDFVPRGNTGFQVKKNSMSKAACTQEMSSNGTVKAVITDLAEKKGAYIIVSGKDDCSDRMLSERRLGMVAAVTNLVNKDDLHLDFYGRDRLTTWLRQYPGVALWVRSRLGKPLSGWIPFGRWAATPLEQDDEFLLDDHPCVIDTNSQAKVPMSIADGIKLTRQRLRAAGSIVRLIGLSGVGKTRFAQALFETDVGEDALPTANVVYADLGKDISPTASELISYLIANDLVAYVILDNCPPDAHRSLQKQVSSSRVKLSLLTIEYDISDDRPEETEVILLEPSSEETVSKLIQKRFPALGNVNADKVAEFSGGNARLAIALASRVKAGETLTNFSDEDLFQRLFNQRRGQADGLRESAEVLSLVYSFNKSESEYNDELTVLATIGGIERRTLYKDHAELLRRQLSQQRGDWRAVLPHALANRLARRALQNITSQDINSELFKRENLRLLKSCAHRLGYLHDFEPARQLANTWVAPGGPLHDISSCDGELLVVLKYIAPVFPDTILTLIETASSNPAFASSSNGNLSLFVNLLCKIAYEDETFDRAAKTILKLAETEQSNENKNTVVKQLSSLFSLSLSGTQATPLRRQAFLNRLLSSGRLGHQEIANKLFHSALETSHFTPLGTFDFGARKRDYGWSPRTHEEHLGWYVGFIELLKHKLTSNDEVSKKWAKGLLSNHFRGLWSFAGCFDILEEIVREHASGGNWSEMWISIKKTIYYDGTRHAPQLLTRLEALEKLAAPSDISSEIEAYALTSTDEHIEAKGGNYTEHLNFIREKVVELGMLAFSIPNCLETWSPRLWENIDALRFFGEGIAKGSPEPIETFEHLVSLMQKQKLEQVGSNVFCGFINAVHTQDLDLARQLQERVLDIPELKPHFVYLLSATPIDTWGAKTLLEVARTGEIEARQFNHISCGRVHETISDEDLIEILLALNELESGVFSSLNILMMRFFSNNDNNYVPTEALRSFGRQTICKLLSMDRTDLDRSQLRNGFHFDPITSNCLSASSPENEIVEIIKLLCNGVDSFRLRSFDLAEIICTLIENFPELLLNRIFIDDEQEKRLLGMLLDGPELPRKPSLNLVPEDRLVKWCNGNQNLIQKVASLVSVYSIVDQGDSYSDIPKRVILTSHIKAFLDEAEDKITIIERIFDDTCPHGWSDSHAEILEVRSRAFAELLEHSSLEVREATKLKLNLIEDKIIQEREKRAKASSQREQRFE